MPLVDDEAGEGEHGEKVPLFPVVAPVSLLLARSTLGTHVVQEL